MNVVTLDDATKYLNIKQVELYAEPEFDFIQDKENEVVTILNQTEPYFRIITSDNTILDCVLEIRVLFGDRKRKIIAELGIDHSTSGFYSRILDYNERCSIFINKYNHTEKEEFESFI